MMLSKKIAKVDKDCVACGNCVQYCPFEAITVHKGLFAKVNASKCKGCGKCIAACPADIITCVERETETI